MAESLRLHGEGMYISEPWLRPRDARPRDFDAEEVAEDVIRRAGLVAKDGPS